MSVFLFTFPRHASVSPPLGGPLGGHVTPFGSPPAYTTWTSGFLGPKIWGKILMANFTGRLEVESFAGLKPREPRKVCVVEATRGVIVTASKGGLGGVRSPLDSLFSATQAPG